MVDTLTTNLGLTNQTEGGNDNTWGTKADDNFELIDDKIGDLTTVTTTGGTTTLTDDQQDVAAIKVNGTLVSNAEIEFDGRGGFWIVWNNTAGAFTVTFLVNGQTGVTVAQGTKTLIWCDGTDIRDGVSAFELLADITPQLGGDLDANTFSIQFDDGTGIKDNSGNEQVRFQKTASAINQIDITNAAVGGSPRIDATGDDTNIDLTLAGKGTGGIVASFKQATGLGLKDSNSSHDLKLKTSSNLAADRTLDLITGDADRSITLGANLTVSGTANVSGTHSGTSSGTNTGDEPTASDTAVGVIEIAVQSEMEAASDTGRAVTPGRQHLHPGMPKAWGRADSDGTLVAGYNVASVGKTTTGTYRVTLTNPMADTNYAVIGATTRVDSDGRTFNWVIADANEFDVLTPDTAGGGSELRDAAFTFAVYGDM